MGVEISKRYPSYKSQPKAFKFVLNLPSNDPHKTVYGNLPSGELILSRG